MPVGLTTGLGKQKTVMTHATYLNVPPTPTRLGIKKGGRGHLISRTRGPLNTKLRAIYGSDRRLPTLFARECAMIGTEQNEVSRVCDCWSDAASSTVKVWLLQTAVRDPDTTERKRSYSHF